MQKKLHRLFAASLVLIFGASCTTAYDAYGRPQQVVDPGAAVIGAAAVGLLAYGLASSNNNDRHHHHHGYHSSRYSRYGSGYGYGRAPACY